MGELLKCETRHSETIYQRLWSGIQINRETGCWDWTKSLTSSGYGKIYTDSLGRRSKLETVHRLMYKLFIGKIPDHMQVCHKCDNKRCVNPTHLYAGTQQDNTNDAKERHLLARGEKNGYAKLTSSQVQQIRVFKLNGMSSRDIGTKFNITQRHANAIIKGNSWNHIPLPAPPEKE